MFQVALSLVTTLSCAHQQALYMSSPSYTSSVLFHSTWSFITTGYPVHFTFPSVQQMCSSSTNRKRKRGRAGNALSQPMAKKIDSNQFTYVCFLLSVHVNSHVCSLPLCRIPKVTADSGYCGSCPKATGYMCLLSLEVCGQRPSLPIDSDQASIACFFDEFCLD